MDLLFLHTPKFHNHYKPIGRFSFILFPPIGLLGLADYLRQNGHSTKMIHLGVEQHKYGSIDVEKIIAENQPAIVGLDLHWHFQSYDVIEVARKIKQASPQTAVLLGGFTASIFAEEILQDFRCVDFVIRGDAEIPLLQLVRQLQAEQAYGDIPNLAYRRGSEVMANPVTHVADSAMLDSICFTDFTLLKDYSTFVECFSRYMHMTELSEPFQRFLFHWQKGFQVYVGRGCVHACSYCGGSQAAHELIAARTCVALRSVDSIVSSICDLQRFGFDSACLALDSFPVAQADGYYVAIFEKLKQLNVDLDIEVERYFPPSPRFVQSFSGLRGKKSFVTLSPHTPNEDLRTKNGLYRYSNQALENCLDHMEAHGVNSLVCFTCGLPFETKKDLEDMAAYQRSLQKKYKRVRIKNCLIEIEPGSAMSCSPGKFELELARTTFADYYRYHSQPSQNHWLEMGYSRQGCPAKEEVTRFFCQHFCERFRLGWASPILCDAFGVMWKAGAFQMLDKILPLSAKN